MLKGGRNPQLDKDLIKYLIKSVERKPQSTTLESLFKYTMRLDDKVCKYMGRTKEDLKNFLKLFPQELCVDESERVYLTKNNLPSASEVSASSNEKNDKPIMGKPILQATGSIYRILGKYGFIELHPPHTGKVYFDGRHVEHGRHMFLIDYGYKEGMKVQLDAVPGPENAEASYRAKHVQKISSPEISSVDGSTSKSGATTSALMMVGQVGKIAQVFDQYGFISRTANKIDDVFFFMNTIVLPEGKQITAPLTNFINPGMEVKFDARPNHRQDAQNNWYATRVWVPGIGNVEKNLLSTEASSLDTLDELRHSEQEIYVSDDENECLDENQRSHPTFLNDESGYLIVTDDTKGKILFGRNYKGQAIYISDVVRVDGKVVEDQAWRFEGGHDVKFDAQTIYMKSENGNSEIQLIATLVWIGMKPNYTEIDLFELYSLYAARHKFTISDPEMYNGFYIDKSITKASNSDKMDLMVMDDLKPSAICRYHDNELLSVSTPGTASHTEFNLYDDHWNSNENGANLPNNRVFLPSPPSQSFDRFFPFTGDSAWRYSISNRDRGWDNMLFDKGVSSLNLVDSCSQTENKIKVQKSVGCQVKSSSLINNSTQTMKLHTKDKGVSTHDLSTKILPCQNSNFLPAKTVSSGCQTDDSVYRIIYRDKYNGESNGKKEIFQLCPNCHYVY